MFDSYLNRVRVYGKTSGQDHKTDADQIMNATWWDDIQSRIGYLYDFYHDAESNKLENLHPETDTLKQPVDIKFIVTQHPTLSNSQIEYYIMFRPGQKRVIDYYEESTCNAGGDYPIGMYIDIPDQDGQYNRWLIVGTDDGTNQFVRYRVMKCNYYLHWCWNQKLYDMCVVLRYRNSYNSGVWSDYLTTTVQNQNLLMFPHNDITQHLYYNERFVIDSRANTQGLESYLTWETSKVESMFPAGVIQLTLAQALFNPLTDKFAPNGFLYADYDVAHKQTNVTDEDEGRYSAIEFNGPHTVRVAGTGLNIKLSFYNKDGTPYDADVEAASVDDIWSVTIFNKDDTTYDDVIIPASSIISINDNDVRNVKVHIDEEIQTDNGPIKGYTLICKYMIIHGHAPENIIDSEAKISIRSL